jgi:cell fate regulator YaaT (PSP1 superfamily)
MVTIVSVKFRTAPKPYYFNPGEDIFHIGEFVIVETVRGLEFGEIVGGNKEVAESEIIGELKPVIRKATEEDKKRNEENQASRKDIMEKATEKVAECKLDMKVVDAECTFDRKKTIIYYLAPNRVDFRELVRKLAAIIPGRIEMRQIYERDDIILKGAYGVCGQPCCCTTFLSDYAKATIKMAKNQNISLNPNSLNGFCARPMCCLRFEDDFYREELKKCLK